VREEEKGKIAFGADFVYLRELTARSGELRTTSYTNFEPQSRSQVHILRRNADPYWLDFNRASYVPTFVNIY